MTENWYSEALLAPRLGVTRSGLEDLRKSLVKKNEAKKIGRQNFINGFGLKKILAELGSPSLDCSGCILHSTNGESEVVELVITKIFPNVHLIQAAFLDGDPPGGRVLVRVMRNTNFRPRMKIKARPPGAPPAPQLYTLEGRCPRFPGKW